MSALARKVRRLGLSAATEEVLEALERAVEPLPVRGEARGEHSRVEIGETLRRRRERAAAVVAGAGRVWKGVVEERAACADGCGGYRPCLGRRFGRACVHGGRRRR